MDDDFGTKVGMLVIILQRDPPWFSSTLSSHHKPPVSSRNHAYHFPMILPGKFFRFLKMAKASHPSLLDFFSPTTSLERSPITNIQSVIFLVCLCSKSRTLLVALRNFMEFDIFFRSKGRKQTCIAEYTPLTVERWRAVCWLHGQGGGPAERAQYLLPCWFSVTEVHNNTD